jgi:hypothetical protein
LAGGLGFEPRQSESESEGLPLADPPSLCLSSLVIAFAARLRKALAAELFDQAGQALLCVGLGTRWRGRQGCGGHFAKA